MGGDPQTGMVIMTKGPRRLQVAEAGVESMQRLGWAILTPEPKPEPEPEPEPPAPSRPRRRATKSTPPPEDTTPATEEGT